VRNRWGIEQGFPKGPVYAITQTTDGYLWIGTAAGLLRFDGKTFRLITDDTGSFTIGRARGLVATDDGSLWVRLEDRTVVRYRNGGFERPSSDPESYIGVFAIATGSHGEVLIARTEDEAPDHKPGMVVPLVFRNGRFQKLTSATDILQSAVISLAQMPSGDIWMGTREAGLGHFTADQTSAVKPGLPDLKVNCLLANSDRDLWVGTDSGIVRWNGTELVNPGIPSSMNHFQALSMVRDRDANVWVGTDSMGLLRLNSNGLASLRESDGVTSGAVTSVYEDREGNLWIGGADGIERIGDSAFVTYSIPEGLPTEGSKPVFVESEGRVWFPPVQGGLWWVKDGLHGRVTGDWLDRDVVYTLAGKKRELWIGRQRGGLTKLYYHDNLFETHTYTSEDGLAQNSVYSVYQARDGAVWAGTLSGGVSRFKDGRFTNYTVENGLASNTVASILEGSDGTMWFATPSGLSAFSGGRWWSYTTGDGLPSENINCLWEDSTRILWVGTGAGIAFRSGKTFQVPSRAPEALRDQILGIAGDGGGSLWLATSNHVLRVNREKLVQASLGEADVREFGLEDGLRGVQGVKRHQSVFVDPIGRIWFSLKGGISVVNPARLTKNSAPAIVHLQTITADGLPIRIETAVHIPGGHQRITFGFAGLNYSTPERVHYRYLLDGFDHDWSGPTAAREATYTNLPPRSYRFRVIASNADGLWTRDEASIDFRVDPLFWQTWWFRLSVSIGSALSIYSAYHLRMRQVTGQLRGLLYERLAERERIARDLHDTFFQGIQGLLLCFHTATTQLSKEEPARRILEETLKQSDKVMLEGRELVLDLRTTVSEPHDLPTAFTNFGEGILKGGSHDFKVVVNGAIRPLHPVVFEELLKIAKEALSNAFRHSSARSIEAELNYERGELRIRIRDDGTGIDPAILRRGHRDGHFGLPGMRERAKKLGAHLDVWSRTGAGTEVELRIAASVAYVSEPNGSRFWKLQRLWHGTKQEVGPEQKGSAST
jgi:ligand-binding sensor domain-containing protein/signal transduction histidine kinase